MRSPTRPAVLDTKRKAKKHDAHEQTNLDGPDQTRGFKKGQEMKERQEEGGQRSSGASLMIQGAGAANEERS